MKLKCQNCKKIWNYQGKKKPKKYTTYVACPTCHSSVKLIEAKECYICHNIKNNLKVVKDENQKTINVCNNCLEKSKKVV